MISAPILVITPDDNFGRVLEAALAGISNRVEVRASFESARNVSQPLVCVSHLDGGTDVAGELLELGCPRVIVVLPRAGLAAVVDVMLQSDLVAGVIARENFDPNELATMVRRALAEDSLGLTKALQPGTPVHAISVGDDEERARCIETVMGFVGEHVVPRNCRDAIEQCLDEMVTNALYDAPVDEAGTHVFAGIPPRTRITLRTEQTVTVQYATDGKRFAISVRDAFGSLSREIVLRYLHKCLHAREQMDRKAGGAGVGLYLVVNTSTAVMFHVTPGVATEAVCVFDLMAPKLQLERFGVFRHEVAETVVPPRRTQIVPTATTLAKRRRRRLAIAATAVIGCALGVLIAPRIFRSTPKDAILRLDSTPPGAQVRIDGRPIGTTPVVWKAIEPGATVAVDFRFDGYKATTVELVAPDGGDELSHTHRLELSPEFVSVRFVSEPPGAEIVETGKPSGVDRTYTPATLFVPVNKLQRFTLLMHQHEPLVIEPFTPAPGEQGLKKGGELVPKP